MDEEELLKHVDIRDRNRPRLKESGVPIEALVAYYQKVANQDMSDVADAYCISVEDVQRALAYYRRHPERIDARILLNS